MNGATANSRDYHHRREDQERRAADRAASDAARLIHQELADRYAALTRAS